MKFILSFLITATIVTGTFTGFTNSKNLPIDNISMDYFEKKDEVKICKTDELKTTLLSYSNTNIRFNYPIEWSISENPTEDILYVEFSDLKIDTEPILKFSTGETWLVDFDRTKEDYEIILSRIYSNVNIKELTKESINDNEVVKLIFTCILNDKEYSMVQYQMINGYTSFIFKYIVSDEIVDNIEDKADSVIKSIEFF